MKPRMSKWYFKLHGGAQAYRPVGLFITERKARAWIRGWLGGVKRLPNGTEVWRAG